MHRGEANSGHYYAFAKTAMAKWYQFNDEIVSEASHTEVFNNNFGGNLDSSTCI